MQFPHYIFTLKDCCSGNPTLVLWFLCLFVHAWAQHHRLPSGSNSRCSLQVVCVSQAMYSHLIRGSSSWSAGSARLYREDERGNKGTEVEMTFPKSHCWPCQSLARPQCSQSLCGELSPAPENLWGWFKRCDFNQVQGPAVQWIFSQQLVCT